MSTKEPHDVKSSQSTRQRWMRVFALSELADLQELAPAIESDITFLRAPETAMIMARGRIGGNGAPFNLGEIPITRCAVSLGDSNAGYSVIVGRDKTKAKLAAILDAVMQHPNGMEMYEHSLLQPLEQRLNDKKALTDKKTEATRVDFFTMVRGD
jgi:alpha-D-ribose 1-methylphosphonate 5-triphosphate synthase subunit PhnG